MNLWACKHLPCFVAKSRSVCRSSRIAREWSIAHLIHPAGKIRLLHFNLVDLTTPEARDHTRSPPQWWCPWFSATDPVYACRKVDANRPNNAKYVYIYIILFTHKCVKRASIPKQHIEPRIDNICLIPYYRTLSGTGHRRDIYIYIYTHVPTPSEGCQWNPKEW